MRNKASAIANSRSGINSEEPFSARLIHKPHIIFHKAKYPDLNNVPPNDEGVSGQNGGEEEGDSTPNFYQLLLNKSEQHKESPNQLDHLDGKNGVKNHYLCPICKLEVFGVEEEGQKALKRHNRSTAHLSAVPHSESTLSRLHIGPESRGFQILESQGWHALLPHGLGPEGREGRREPVKASRVKNDTIGLGSTLKPKSDGKFKKQQQKTSAKEIREMYKKEQEKRQALFSLFGAK